MSIDKSILKNNLNDQISYHDFFTVFGYSEDEKVFLRTFKDKGAKDSGRKYEIDLKHFDSILPALRADNKNDRGIYFVVNGGGQSDKEVKTAKAQFIENDDLSFEDQIDKLNEFPLEPSVIIKTRKSLHCYWLLWDGDIKQFKNIQERMIDYFKSDQVIKNESRVMRLYGFEHRKEDPIVVTLIKFDPLKVYSQDQLSAVLPLLTTDPAKEKTTKEKSQQTVSRKQTEVFNSDLKEDLRSRLLDYVELITTPSPDGAKDFYCCPFCGSGTHRGSQSSGAFHVTDDLWYCQACNRGGDIFTLYAEKNHLDVKRNFPQIVEGLCHDLRISVRSDFEDLDQTDQQPEEQKKRSKAVNVSNYLIENFYDQDIEYFKQYKDRKIGFGNIDKYMTLYPGLCCLGGASSLGKTTFAVNIVDNLLIKGESVIYFSLEQLPIELITKSLARRMYYLDPASTITNIDIKNGASSDALIKARTEYSQIARNYTIIEGDFHVTAKRIIDYVEAYINITGVKPIVVIDYLQLIAPPDDFKGTQREIIDENLKALKDMSKRNELFVLLISSFNRASYKEPVSMESFKESGMIEYTCDYLLALQLSILEDSSFYTSTGVKGGEKDNNNDKKEKKLFEAIDQNPKEVELVALKNRNGKQRFKCFFNYDMKYDTFTPDFNSKYDQKSAKSDFGDLIEGFDKTQFKKL